MQKRWRLVALLCACAVLFAGYLIYRSQGVDHLPPVISIAGDSTSILEVSMANMHETLLQDIVALDDRDGDVTDSVLVEQIGNIDDSNCVQVIYVAFDGAGNVSKFQRAVRLADYTGPRFTLDEPLNFVYGTGFDPLKLVGAEDLIDGDIRHRVKATLMDEVAISAEGTHNVLFRVTNSLSDTEQLVLPVEVYYAGRYDAQLFLTDYLVYLPLNGTFSPESYLEEYRVYGQAMDLKGGVPEGLSLTIDGQVNTNQPGVYAVRYTMSSTRGNQTSCGYTRLIVVVEG